MQQIEITRLADFNNAKACQMVGHELAIEQGKPANSQTCDQPGKRDFRRIGCPRKHALTKKSPTKRKAVQPANKLAVLPAFDTMRVAHFVQRNKRILDIGIDPRRHPLTGFSGTGVDHAGKSGIGRYDKPVLPDHLGQRTRYNKTIKRQDCAKLRLDPECFGIITRIGHREHPAPVRTHQKVEIKRHEPALARYTGCLLSRIAQNVMIAYRLG